MASARLTPYLVDQMVSVLAQNPDRCVVMALDMTPNPRIVREGKRWTLHRYLFYRVNGVPLPSRLCLLPGGCTTRGCLNPGHRIATTSHGAYSRRTCVNGHEYTPSNISHGTRWKCVKCHAAWNERRRTSTHQRGVCRNGHKMTKSNVYRWLDANGTSHRRCRRCQLNSQHAYRNRKKENR